MSPELWFSKCWLSTSRVVSRRGFSIFSLMSWFILYSVRNHQKEIKYDKMKSKIFGWFESFWWLLQHGISFQPYHSLREIIVHFMRSMNCAQKLKILLPHHTLPTLSIMWSFFFTWKFSLFFVERNVKKKKQNLNSAWKTHQQYSFEICKFWLFFKMKSNRQTYALFPSILSSYVVREVRCKRRLRVPFFEICESDFF